MTLFFALLNPIIHHLVYGLLQPIRLTPFPCHSNNKLRSTSLHTSRLRAHGSVGGIGWNQAAILFTFSSMDGQGLLLFFKCCYVRASVIGFPFSLAYVLSLLSLVTVISFNHTVKFKSIITAELNQPIFWEGSSLSPLSR